MSDFMELPEPPERDFLLPIQYRPSKIMLHSRHYPDSTDVYHICRVMPSGEVFVAKGAALEDVAVVLMQHYKVDFAELNEIWDLEDAFDGTPLMVKQIGCPACAPIPEGPIFGKGCEQCEGAGWVYLVPNHLSPEEVKRQIAEIVRKASE